MKEVNHPKLELLESNFEKVWWDDWDDESGDRNVLLIEEKSSRQSHSDQRDLCEYIQKSNFKSAGQLKRRGNGGWRMDASENLQHWKEKVVMSNEPFDVMNIQIDATVYRERERGTER
jgi:hypothetical protein